MTYVENKDIRIGTFQKYVPMLIFLAFIFPNTMIEPLSGIMFKGRWIAFIALVGIFILNWLVGQHLRVRYAPASGSIVFLIITYLLLGFSVLYSYNFIISAVKWAVFLFFLMFCFLHSQTINSRNDIIEVLSPIMKIFIIMVWFVPVSIYIYPQVLWGYIGALNGFFRWAPALGHFIALFGVPVALYKIKQSERGSERLFYIATLVLAMVLVFYSKSRSSFTLVMIFLFIEFMKIRTGRDVAFLKAALVLAAFGGFVYFNADIFEELRAFFFKYSGTHTILESRTMYWQNTLMSFEQRPLLGHGFGVQEELSSTALDFTTSGLREQGSTALGLLEEAGFSGIPLMIAYTFLGFRSAMTVLFSDDRLNNLLAQVYLVGLGLSLIENYLFYLGNSLSILVFIAIFYKERLYMMERYERLGQATTARIEPLKV